MKPTRVPFRSILSARAALCAALVWPWTLAVVGDVARRAMYPGNAAFAAVVNLAGAALIYAAARYALRARTRGAAIGRLVVARAALAVASIVALSPGEFSRFNALEMAIASVTTVPVSLTVLIAMVVIVWPVLRTPSYEAEDRALIRIVMWMLVPSVLGAAFALSAAHFFANYGGDILARSLAIQLVMFGTVPGGLAVAAAVRVGLRRRWLSRVDEGREPTWRLVDRGESEADLPVLTSSTPVGPTRILARVLSVSPTDPFREAEGLEPVAIVRSRPGQSPAAEVLIG
jgi:hypothetical protein